MEDGIHRIQSRVKELLEYARPHELELAPTNVNAMVEKVLSFLEPTFEKAGVHVDKHLGREVPAALPIDADQFEQVLVNVLLNAVQASKPGGRVRVATQRVDGRCRINIADDGGGIPRELQGRVFDLFFTTKADQGGTGLGLPVSQRIVEAHGGGLWIESEENRETKVIIELPVSNAPSLRTQNAER